MAITVQSGSPKSPVSDFLAFFCQKMSVSDFLAFFCQKISASDFLAFFCQKFRASYFLPENENLAWRLQSKVGARAFTQADQLAAK